MKFSRTVKRLLLLVLCAVAGGCASVDKGGQHYDLVIRNARVLDGAGNPWFAADVAIHNGRFARIGIVDGQGKTEINAKGRYLSPGWIDMMDQSGRALLASGRAENKLRMGVTTLIAGEDGTPVAADQIPAYFAQLRQQGIAVNFGTYYAAHQARAAVMGDVAGPPNAKQMLAMKSAVETAMEAGVFGISSALIYPPSSFQSTEELIELAKVTAPYGGIYASHIRDEGEHLLTALHEAARIGEQGDVRVEVFHLKAAWAPGWGSLMRQAGELIDNARQRDVDIAADIYPYIAGGTWLGITVPNWLFEEGHQQGLQKLADPNTRKLLARQSEAGSLPGWSNLVFAAGGWHRVVLANANSEQYARFNGMNILDISKVLNKSVTDTAWDIVLAAPDPGRPAMALYYMMSERDVETALQFDWTSIGSDAAAVNPGEVDLLGLPHPRAYGSFPRVIAKYVKQRKILSLPEAIRKMTSLPASRMRLHDRGLIREGLWADAVLFDYDKLDDRASWAQPEASPEGIEAVLVNGELVLHHGVHTGALPGKVLLGQGATIRADISQKSLTTVNQ